MFSAVCSRIWRPSLFEESGEEQLLRKPQAQSAEIKAWPAKQHVTKQQDFTRDVLNTEAGRRTALEFVASWLDRFAAVTEDAKEYCDHMENIKRFCRYYRKRGATYLGEEFASRAEFEELLDKRGDDITLRAQKLDSEEAEYDKYVSHFGGLAKVKKLIAAASDDHHKRT